MKFDYDVEVWNLIAIAGQVFIKNRFVEIFRYGISRIVCRKIWSELVNEQRLEIWLIDSEKAHCVISMISFKIESYYDEAKR